MAQSPEVWRRYKERNREKIRAKDNAYYQANKAKRALGKWLTNIKRRGGTYAWFEAKLREQGGLCGICSVVLGPYGRVRQNAWVVDHNHATGAPRGLICRLCNMGLGMFRDDPVALSRAVHYLLADGGQSWVV